MQDIGKVKFLSFNFSCLRIAAIKRPGTDVPAELKNLERTEHLRARKTPERQKSLASLASWRLSIKPQMAQRSQKEFGQT
jgi:hypothetical protein